MRTESFKRTDIEESWVLLDAEGKTLGRFASEVANILSGKNKPEYTNVKCEHIMTRGKNKGNKCGKNCQLGYFRCGLHNNSNKSDKDNKEIKT